MADLTAMLQAAAGAGGDYQISRSLRFNSADSAYLSRTPASASNRKTWTLNFWIKRSFFNADNQHIFGATSDSYNTNYVLLTFIGGPDERLRLTSNGHASNYELVTTQVFRDVSAWYMITIAFDTTQATASNRIKFYVNGTQITAFGTATYPTQNLDSFVNNNIEHTFGTSNRSPNGYLTEINLIDGSALTPSSFGEVDAITGVWKPIAYAGTYGTNGFHLDFSDNSSTAALGYDAAGSNDWTPNNFSVTAGAGNDSLVDTPTQYGTDTGAGGEVRGNYCTWNPLNSNTAFTLSNGNLDASSTSAGEGSAVTTIAVSSGKWYCEITQITVSAGNGVGIADATKSYLTNQFYVSGVSYFSNGSKTVNNSNSAYGASYTDNDVIGIALDLDAGTVTFYKNGSSQGTAASGLSGPFYFAITDASSSGATAFVANFGQRPFAYTAPSGFKALCTTNLPDPTVVQGDDYFNTVLYTGTGSLQSITGVGFQPDFVWVKSRSANWSHALCDAVRGASKGLASNSTAAEDSTSGSTYYITAFNSDGFSVQNGGAANNTGDTYVGWNWKANGAGSSNTDGTITSTVSANTTAGISIVTYTGNGTAGATVGHGLGAVPRMIIVKNRDQADAWQVYHAANTANPETDYLVLNTTAATADALDRWNDTAPTSSVFSLGDGVEVNTNTENYVAYCFASISGFSAFGSYTGNGSADGPFIYTGFRPAWILFKVASGLAGESWTIYDTKRGTYNVMGPTIFANLSNAEATNNSVDVLSNGFKLRSNSSALNYNTATMIFAAFAENPFKYSLAR